MAVLLRNSSTEVVASGERLQCGGFEDGKSSKIVRYVSCLWSCGPIAESLVIRDEPVLGRWIVEERLIYDGSVIPPISAGSVFATELRFIGLPRPLKRSDPAYGLLLMIGCFAR